MIRWLLILCLILSCASADARIPFAIPHGGGLPAIQPQPPTVSLSANPATIQQGNSSILTWGSSNATSCAGTNFPTGGLISGTFSVTPSVTTQYTVTCTGTGGSAQKNTTVTVTVPPPQSVVAATLDNANYVVNNAAPVTVGNLGIQLNPTSPPFSGTVAMATATGGCSDSDSFQLTSNKLPAALQAKAGVGPSTFSHVCVVPTQAGLIGSGSPQTLPAITGTSGVVGNCPSGATDIGCAIYPGGSSTLVDGAGVTWQFINNTCYINCTYFPLSNSVNGTNPPDGKWIDGGFAGTVAVIDSNKQIRIRGWKDFWYLITPTTHTVTGATPSPSFTTVVDPPWAVASVSGVAQSVNILAPSNSLYAASSLTIKADQLPTNGTIVLADGVTPISLGQTLTGASLTGLKFIPSAVSSRQSRSSSFTYTVQDPALQVAIGTAGFTVKPNQLWADSTVVPLGGAGIDYPPTLAQPANADDIVAVRVNNTSGGIFASGKTFYKGQLFLPSTVAATDTLCARPTGSGSCSVYVQMSVLRKNEDSSVRHAVVAFNIDTSISAGVTRDFMLSKCGAGHATSCPSAPAAAPDNVALAAGAEFASGSVGASSYSCKSILAAANSGIGPLTPSTTETWASGPVLKAYVALGNVAGLRFKCEIYSRSDGSVVTDIVPDNTRAFTTGPGDFTANFSSTQDSFSQNNVQFFRYGVYEHTVGSASTPQLIGGQYFQDDIPYMLATNAFPLYDRAYGVNDAFLVHETCGSDPSGNNGLLATGCYALNAGKTGNTDPFLGDVGPRPELGPVNGWATQYLMSGQVPVAFQIMLGNGRMAGQIAWNFTDEQTGAPICGDASCSHGIGDFNVNTFLANGPPCSGDGTDPCHAATGAQYQGQWGAFDNALAHHPSLAYVPYIVSGNHYWMELEGYYSSIVSVIHAHAYGSVAPNAGDIGLHNPGSALSQWWSDYNTCHNFNNSPCSEPPQTLIQLRHHAWMIRTFGEAAYILPDTYATKSFITNQLTHGVVNFINNYLTGFDLDEGQLQGVGTNMISGNGHTIFYHQYYIHETAAWVASLGLQTGSPAARRLTKFYTNYNAGGLTSGQKGFPEFNGTVYYNGELCNFPDCATGGRTGGTTTTCGNPSMSGASDVPMNSWAILFNTFCQQTTTVGLGTYPGFSVAPGYIDPGGTPATGGGGAGGGANGGYPQLALAGLAAAIKVAPSPDVLSHMTHAWAADYLMIVQAYDATGNGGFGGMVQDYQYTNMFGWAPVFPDGSEIHASNIQVSPSGSAIQSCTTIPCMLGATVETGLTYTQSSSNASGMDVMVVNAIGGSQIGPGAATGGGGGTGAQTCSPNGADCEAVSGCGAGTQIGGGGNDVLVPGGTCYGTLSAQTIQFGTNTISKTKQIGYATDYAGVVGGFRPTTDHLRIKANLNGQNPAYSSGADFVTKANCQTTSGDTICTLAGANNTLILKGVTSSIAASVVIF